MADDRITGTPDAGLPVEAEADAAPEAPAAASEAPATAPEAPATATETPANATAPGADTVVGDAPDAAAPASAAPDAEPAPADGEQPVHAAEDDASPPETIGGEDIPAEGDGEGEEDRRERRIPPRFLRHYKIQEVIKRRQIMLVQVVKEERGGKGAALTSYISLAGRFSVLMPNSPRGGGVSRKITSAADRKRLREAIDEMSLPDGMSLIVRTAGAQRPKPEIKRDCEYLLRLWDNIRERTLASTAPALIYEEADLIKRSIRDVFGRDIEEVAGRGRGRLQPGARVHAHADARQARTRSACIARRCRSSPATTSMQQLDAMHSPIVQLKSGGYIVINQTEALVAIDVNSGRATRDRHIEDTALRTNLEASDEIARQLRLRDLAGLIVIDFIDMESAKHDAMVERRTEGGAEAGPRPHPGRPHQPFRPARDVAPAAAPLDRRTRPSSPARTARAAAPCAASKAAAFQVLRAIEEEGAKRRAAEIVRALLLGRRAVAAQPQARQARRDRGALRHERAVRAR